jgi:hypothetical protein
LRRTGKFHVDGRRRQGFYLPPARASAYDPADTQEFPEEPSPIRRHIPFVVDVNSPYDPFAGNTRPFS